MNLVAVNKNGRVYLPARWVAEAMDYFVTWDGAQQAVIIKPLQVARVALLASRTGDLQTFFTMMNQGSTQTAGGPTGHGLPHKHQ